MPELDTNISAAFSRLRTPERKRAFPVPTQILPIQRKKELLKRRDRALARKFIRPENAQRVLDALPREEGDRTHAIIAGDFVFNDLLCDVARLEGPGTVAIATLSMSKKNVEALERQLIAGDVTRLTLVLTPPVSPTPATA